VKRAADFGKMDMKKIAILLIASTLVLSACGKRSEGTATTQGPTGYDANGQPVGGTPGLGAAVGQTVNVRVRSSEPSLMTGGNQTAEITAQLTNDKNQPLVAQAVEFVTSGGVIQAADAETNDVGEAKATLSIQYDHANQPIIVTVTSGNFDGAARVVAEGSEIEITGENNVVLGNDVEITATLKAGDGTAIDNEVVSITSRAGNTLSISSAVTDPQGAVTVIAGSNNGEDTITFSALNDAIGVATVTGEHQYTVADDQLKFADGAATELTVNNAHSFEVTWSNNGTPIAGSDLIFSITAGQIIGASTVTTDASGKASVNVLSSIAGEVTLYVSAADGSVNNKHVFKFYGDQPADLLMSSTSTRVNTTQNATIVALVQDANGNPVKDADIVFSSSNLKGGQLSSTTGVTDVDGEAQITFTAGNSATEVDEIAIVAEVAGTAINQTINLTVAEPVLNVNIGSSNQHREVPSGTQYRISYVVQVADGSGQPLADALVQLSVAPVSYMKGTLVGVDSKYRTLLEATAQNEGDTWARATYDFHSSYIEECASEDANGNRILDAGEDNNSNGNLDPQDPALITAIVPESGSVEDYATIEGNGTLRTDATGSGYFDLVYPVSNSGWAVVKITARAQELGVEAEDAYSTRLIADADEMKSDYPNNYYSPYGQQLDCTNDQ